MKSQKTKNVRQILLQITLCSTDIERIKSLHPFLPPSDLTLPSNTPSSVLTLAEKLYSSDSHGVIDRLVREVDTYHQVADRDAKDSGEKKLGLGRDVALGFIVKYIIAPLTPVLNVSPT